MYKSNNKKPFWVCVLIALILFSSLSFVSCDITSSKPSFYIHYKIQNLAGLEDTSFGQGLTFENTFSVSGTIELKNYKSDLIVLTAKAMEDNNNAYIPIFTTINYYGNGIYDFTMSSFYKNGITWVTKIVDIEVKES